MGIKDLFDLLLEAMVQFLKRKKKGGLEEGRAEAKSMYNF